MEYNIVHNKDHHRFEIAFDDNLALVDYKLFDGGIAFMHTEVPKALEGRGIASALAKHVLDYAAENHLKVKPYCPYINSWIDRHPDYQENSLFHNKQA